MAYVFKLPQTVTEEIMRYAIGYPRDRLRAIAADVVRTEIHFSKPCWRIDVTWWGAGRGNKWFRGGFRMIWHNDMRCLLMWLCLERDRERKMDLLQQQSEACEPAELALQRTHF